MSKSLIYKLQKNLLYKRLSRVSGAVGSNTDFNTVDTGLIFQRSLWI